MNITFQQLPRISQVGETDVNYMW